MLTIYRKSERSTLMRIDSTTHCIAGAEYMPSPNCDDRPGHTNIDLLVIHNISLPPGEFANGCVKDFFLNRLDSNAHPYFQSIKDMRVSSHLFIERDGKLTQFVPFHKRAWHAGKSCHQGRQACNDFSIGIELEGDDNTEYTDHQYNVLNAVIVCLQMTYPGLSGRRIVGHSDIAAGRKTDPGPAFDWGRLEQ